MIIGKTYIFDSSHHIKDHNRCGKVHGHTWTLTVMIDGEIELNGFVIDFHILNDIVRPIVAKLDHEDINEVLHPMAPITCETLCQWFVNQIRKNNYHRIEGRIGCRLQEGLGGWTEVWED